MRYIIQFADKTTKHLSEQEGKQALSAWSAGKPVIIRGAGFAHHLISAIKPITKDWYDPEYVRQDHRAEVAHLPPAEQHKLLSDAKMLGFSDARELHETKDTWKKLI